MLWAGTDCHSLCSKIYVLLLGYFTSRPTLKGYVRELNSLLQTCSQLDAIIAATGGKPSSSFTIRKLRKF